MGKLGFELARAAHGMKKKTILFWRAGFSLNPIFN